MYHHFLDSEISMQSIQGVFANLPTAFSKDGSIDAPRMRERIASLLESGVHGFSTQLSAGEFAYMTAEERMFLTSCVLEAVGEKRPVLVGVSGNSTQETLQLAKHAADHGAAAAMVMPRSYFKLSASEILGLYEEVGRSVPCPIGVYNNPVTTGVDISAELYLKIQQVCPVAVTKDGAGDITRISELRSLGSAGMSYLCGTESQSLPSLVLGADGCCNAINSVIPAPIVTLYDAAQQKDYATAARIFESLQPLFRFIRMHGVARTTKAMGDLLNRSFGPHRMPLQPLSQDDVARLRSTIDEIRTSTAL